MPGIYVFDYDGTLRPLFCGGGKNEAQERVRDVIQYALTHGHALGINTARHMLTPKHKNYLQWLGINVDALPRGAVQLRGVTSKKKVRNLERIKQTYEMLYGPIDRAHIMFFDDKKSNVDAALQAGYNAALVARQGSCRSLNIDN